MSQTRLTILRTTGAIAVDGEDRPRLGLERRPRRPHLGSAYFPLKIARNQSGSLCNDIKMSAHTLAKGSSRVRQFLVFASPFWWMSAGGQNQPVSEVNKFIAERARLLGS